MSNVYEKLMMIQGKLKAPKGQRNSFGNYNYRSAEDILEAVKPLLQEQECILILTDTPIVLDGWHYVKATAKLIAASDTDGTNTIEVEAVARESAQKKGMDDSQITGTASSYARKYALNGLFAIDDAKDADTNEYQLKTDGTSKREQDTMKICKEIAELAKKDGISPKELTQIVHEKYKVKNSLDCTFAELEDLKKNYKAYYAELNAEAKNE